MKKYLLYWCWFWWKNIYIYIICRCAGSSNSSWRSLQQKKETWRSWRKMERRWSCCSKPNYWLADQKDWRQLALLYPRQVRDWLQSMYTCCRYGQNWARWRQINGGYPKDGNEATLDLGLDANLKITSVTGTSNNIDGDTSMLQARLSDGATWGPHGVQHRELDGQSESERPSPSFFPLILSHMSGDESTLAWSVCFHWKPQWGGAFSALPWF